MLDMRRLVRQTNKTGELEGKYDARVFILVACRLLPWQPITMVTRPIGLCFDQQCYGLMGSVCKTDPA